MDHVALGRVVDRYEIVRLLGEGGMARVYLVRHATLGTQHALKLLTSASEPVKERLLREGRIQGQLRDPGVVNVTDVIDVDGGPGLVMEFVDGPTLQTWIQRRAPSLPQADAMAREILRVMAAAHAAGLIHRDLKPANILIEIGHAGLQPKIADFGLAKVFATDAAPSTTRSGVMMGTPQYMAPEQIRDAARVDARADVFSLGAILVELVTGRRAFDGDDLVEVFAAIDAAESLDPTSRVPDLPARMVDAIRGCLRRNPADRFADAGEVLKAWTRGAEEPLLKSWSEADRQEARALRSTPLAVDRASGDHPTLTMSSAPRSSGSLGSPAPAPVATLTSAPGALSQGRSPGIEPAATSTPPRRSRAWLAVLAVGLAVATAVGVARWRPAVHDGPHVVVVSDDPATQARSEQVWALIHAGEIRRASVLAEEVAAAAPESAWAQFTHGFTTRSGASAQRERAARLADPSTPDGAFVRLLDDTVHLRAGQAEWDAFEAAHPGFPLAAYFRTSDPTLSVDEKLRLLDRAAVRLPDSVLPLLGKWDVLRPAMDREALRRVIDEAERRFPLSHQVLWRVAQMALDEGDFARQRDAARRGLELAPDDRDLRWQFVVAHFHLHEDDAAMVELERLVGVGPELDRAGSISTITYYTFGLGKLRLTRDLLDRCRALTASASGASVRVACDDTAGTLAFLDGDRTWVRREMEAYRRDVADPAVPEVLRKQTTTSVLFAAGVIQVLDGDLAAADATVARLAELPEDGSLGDAVGTRHDLQAMVSEARRTVDPEYLAYIEEIVGGSALADYLQADHYDLAGFPDLALAEYRQVVAKTRSSSGSAQLLVGEAHSAVRVAELVADTDPAEARAALEVFATTWPTADPDHPFVLRAGAVRARLDAR